MHDLLYLLTGWLLGLLSPGIAGRIRRKHRQRDLVSSVVGELAELQYTLALAAYRFRAKVGTATDEFLDWLLPIVRSYDGPSKSSALAESLAKSRERSEEQRRHAQSLIQGVNRGLALKRYEVPFLLTQANELSICSLDFQRRVFGFKGRLDLFNQQVSFLQSQFDKTFDTLVLGANRAAVGTNLTDGYAELATSAESIARVIGEIMARYGGSRVAS